MADPQFSKPGSIDMLLGGEFFLQLLEQGKIDLGANLPTLQNTKLGWIVSGPIPSRSNASRTTDPSVTIVLTCFHVSRDNVTNQLMKFWEVEECKEIGTPKLSKEKELCESFFQETY